MTHQGAPWSSEVGPWSHGHVMSESLRFEIGIHMEKEGVGTEYALKNIFQMFAYPIPKEVGNPHFTNETCMVPTK